jgi:opacity protein-like surface antigen
VKKHLLIATLLTMSSLAAPAMATTLNFKDVLPTLSNNTWFLSASAGPIWAGNGSQQTITLSPGITKTYTANDTANPIPEGQLFAGLQTQLPYQFIGQFGLMFESAGDANISGDIWDDADPDFDNYNYNYKIMHNALMLKAKFIVDRNYWVDPWFSIAAGIAFNRAHDFTNNPTIFEAVPNANFPSAMQNSFTYSLGIGFQKTVTDHLQVGMGYEFADWGQSHLARAPDQTMGNGGPSLNHLYTNGILFDITYFA